MDAIKFVKKAESICDAHKCTADCPLYDFRYCAEIFAMSTDIAKGVEMVEKWDGYKNKFTFDEYQDVATKSIDTRLADNEKLHHALFGLSAEVGEVTSLYQKYLQGHQLDIEHLKIEIGDVLWMVAELCTAMDLRMSEVAEGNNAKTTSRYPNGFESERSLNREVGDI